MPKTSQANSYQARAAKHLADTWGISVATTYFAFHPDDCVAVLEALNVKQMPGMLRTVGDLMVLSRSGKLLEMLHCLQNNGVSFNFARYAWADSMFSSSSGQVRYGHDGTVQHINLVPDVQISAQYSRYLPGEEVINDVERVRICFVCCGQDSWDNREANGQMHKMRLLLT